MTIEAMKQALEALEKDSPWREETITSLRQAIEQAEKQKPVGYLNSHGHLFHADEVESRKKWTNDVYTPLYTTPQPQEKS
jgi:hypothetical protein